MPVDPHNDPDFLAANPSDQLRYLSAVDPDFAKASPLDQLGYLASLHGVGAVKGPQLPNVTAVDVSGRASGEGASGSKVPRSIQTAPDWVGEAIAGITAAGSATMAGTPIVSAAVPAVAKMIAKHPVLGPMIASEVISKARSVPYIGKLVPPYAEMLPWLIGKGESAPETNPTEVPGPPSAEGENWREPDTGEAKGAPTAAPPPASQVPVAASMQPPSKANNDVLHADRMETSNIQDQIRSYAEGQDRQQLEQVARERLAARMPRKADRPDMGNAAQPTTAPVATGQPMGTPADADLEKLLQDSLAQVQPAKAAH